MKSFSVPTAILCSWLLSHCQAEITVCSEIGNLTCSNAGHRICLDADGEITCGNCIDGYMEFRNECYLIDDVDFSLVDDYIQDYAPQWTSTVSLEVRLEQLEALARYISSIKAQIPPLEFELDLNKFTLDTPEEQQQRLGYRYIEGSNDGIEKWDYEDARRRRHRLLEDVPEQLKPENLPKKVDHAPIMTPVKDQGRCGCCWAVSVAAAVEAAVYLTAGFQQSLSFQQFISCDEDNYGCNGGNVLLAMRYAWKSNYGGVSTLNDYPYTDKEGTTTAECRQDTEPVVTLRDPKIVALVNDPLTREERIIRFKQAVSIQPVSMVLKSGCNLFSSYSSGILTQDGGCACAQPSCIDHAVVLVGYDDTSEPKYWKLRNSWSTSWGEDGYFRIAQDGGGQYGLFGMLAEGAIPLDAYNNTGAVRDLDLDDDPPLDYWQLILVIAAGAVLLCCVGALVVQVCGKKKD